MHQVKTYLRGGTWISASPLSRALRLWDKTSLKSESVYSRFFHCWLQETALAQCFFDSPGNRPQDLLLFFFPLETPKLKEKTLGWIHVRRLSWSGGVTQAIGKVLRGLELTLAPALALATVLALALALVLATALALATASALALALATASDLALAHL